MIVSMQRSLITVEANAATLVRDLGALLLRERKAMVVAVKQECAYLRSAIRRNAPAKTGALKQSIVYRVRTGPGYVVGTVTNKRKSPHGMLANIYEGQRRQSIVQVNAYSRGGKHGLHVGAYSRSNPDRHRPFMGPTYASLKNSIMSRLADTMLSVTGGLY
jgi:hypothetical protein